ncbi:tryptophan-rich sensory protein [Alkalibacillus sp. S2W]|uniref:tryptophan-rich sensory protein n=1 Tax=Alkalibacillus sp. S2W TaxID=3386553 RepID=UPI00398D54D6
MGLKVLNLIMLLLMLGFNVYANLLPLNGQTTGEISDGLNVLLIPADYTFAIWGLIYGSLIIWVIMLFISPNGDLVTESLGYSLIASHIFNMAWLVFFHYEWFGLALLAIVALWITLLISYRRISNTEVSQAWRFPISIYLAWVTVATLISIAIVINVNDGFTWVPPVIGTLFFIWLAAISAIIGLGRTGDVWFPIVMIWALIGITINRLEYPVIAYSSLCIAGLLAVVIISFFFTQQKASRKDND